MLILIYGQSSSAKTSITSSNKASTTTSSKATTTSSAASSGTSAITSYAKTNGLLFDINGKETYFMGTNTYWIGFLTDNADVDLVMSHLAAVCILAVTIFQLANPEIDWPKGSSRLGLQ
jgi:mannan endo-1,4-beta-mannosidase